MFGRFAILTVTGRTSSRSRESFLSTRILDNPPGEIRRKLFPLTVRLDVCPATVQDKHAHQQGQNDGGLDITAASRTSSTPSVSERETHPLKSSRPPGAPGHCHNLNANTHLGRTAQ